MSPSVRISLLDSQTRSGTTVAIEADPRTPVADLLSYLVTVAPSTGPMYLDHRPLTSFATVGDLHLTDGQIITIGGPGLPLHDADGRTGVDVLVAGGPDAGRVVNLAPGSHEIGRDAHRSLSLSDPEVSRRHAQIDVTPTSTTFRDLEASNTTIVDGVPVEGSIEIRGGECLRLGRTALSIVAPEPADTALVRGADGTLTYNRRFRSAGEETPQAATFPREHEDEPPPSISLLYVFLPVVTGVVLALVVRNPMFLIFAGLGPITGIVGMVASRRQHKHRQARLRAKAEAALEQARSQHREALRVEMRNRREAAPDPATLVRAARGPRRQLWERRPADHDFLDLRVGLADQPSTIKLTGETAPPTPLLPDIPVTVPLIECDSVGVAGPSALANGIARTLLFQIAALHSPGDVRIVVLSPDANWGWTRWLPHVRAGADGDRLLIGGDATSLRSRLTDLETLIAARKKEMGPYGGVQPLLPRYLVLLDHPSTLDRARIGRILAEGPSVGLHAICIEDTEPELPEEYTGASITPLHDRLTVRVRGRKTISGVSEEIINLRHLETAARCLAPLRPESTATAALPSSVRFLDLIGMTEPTSSLITSSWRTSDGRCRAVVGSGVGGGVDVELDDRTPHGLVAGTSGAGKSEFLKTYLAGLAINNHPDDLQFLLIDFKGGGDFRTLARLPHTIDLVTNTDDSDNAAVKRALGLLEAEVERRQRLVNEHGARDLASYRTLRRTTPDLPVMGRILVVADEFGELATREPELLDKMVSVARVGRAMGVHLLLATQRPSGAVTPQIQANVPLRICFRVLEGQADEVIGSKEPERIPTKAAGRGYVRVGDEEPMEVQCARVANARPSVAVATEPVTVEVESWAQIGHPRTAEQKRVEVPDSQTDLWTIVEAISEAAARVGWVENPVPWPRPLPESLRFSPQRVVTADATGRPGANIGLRDDPRAQRHVPYPIIVGGGNVAIVGAPGSGRSTTLRTVAVGLAYACPPNLLHIHALDFAGRSLTSLNPLPHVGTVTDDPGIASRLLDRLEDEVADRRAQFAAAGWSNLHEQWASTPAPDRQPAIVLFIDGWAQLAELGGTGRSKALAERVVKLLGDGSGVGLQAVIAGDRTAAGTAIGRLMQHRLVLRFNDPADYSYLDVDPRHVPRPHPDGRALLPAGRGPVEQIQVSHVGRDAQGITQLEALRAIGRHLTDAAGGFSPPFRLAPLPLRVELATLLENEGPPPGARLPIIVGVGGDEARPMWVDLDERAAGFLVAGPAGSGRSSALRTIAIGAVAAGREVLIGITRRSPLSELEGAPGIRAVVRWGEIDRDLLEKHLADRPPVVLVDDVDALTKNDPLMTLVSERCETGVRLVAAGATDTLRDVMSGWISPLRAAKTGLLLWPGSNFDGGALGLSESVPSELQFSRPAGRGLWVEQRRMQVVQVPMP